MPRRSPPKPADLLADPGVLEPVRTLEVFGDRAVAEVGGVAVIPHRGSWLRARERRIEASGWFDGAATDSFRQVVVHLQKGRAATEQGLAEAWARLEDGGRMILVGGNELGIKSAVKRLAAELDEPPEILATRARARVACWRKTDHRLDPPSIDAIEVVTPTDHFTLRSAPGVFSADALDPGTALLLDHIEDLESPNRVFDPGCGLGVIGLAALRRWPTASAVLAEVDRRSVGCAERNARELGVADRCRVVWWDAVSEPPPVNRCDLVLVNPPFHSGVPVDLQPARAIFKAIDTVLDRGGRGLVVANRTLPWERDLRPMGRLRQLTDERGYKLLELTR